MKNVTLIFPSLCFIDSSGLTSGLDRHHTDPLNASVVPDERYPFISNKSDLTAVTHNGEGDFIYSTVQSIFLFTHNTIVKILEKLRRQGRQRNDEKLSFRFFLPSGMRPPLI